MDRLILIIAIAGCAACASGSKQPKSWRDDWGKPCFANADCGGGLYCQNPGDPVGSGAAVDPTPPACPAEQVFCDGGCVAACTPTSCAAGSTCTSGCCIAPPVTESCDATACERSGGRCADNKCVQQGVCEAPPA